MKTHSNLEEIAFYEFVIANNVFQNSKGKFSGVDGDRFFYTKEELKQQFNFLYFLKGYENSLYGLSQELEFESNELSACSSDEDIMNLCLEALKNSYQRQYELGYRLAERNTKTLH